VVLQQLRTTTESILGKLVTLSTLSNHPQNAVNCSAPPCRPHSLPLLWHSFYSLHFGILALPLQSLFWHALSAVPSGILPTPCLPQQPLHWSPDGFVQGTQSTGAGEDGDRCLGFEVFTKRSQATNLILPGTP
jgi:hypothetical protein